MQDKLNTSYQQELKNEQDTFNLVYIMTIRYKSDTFTLTTTNVTTVLTCPADATVLVKNLQAVHDTASNVDTLMPC